MGLIARNEALKRASYCCEAMIELNNQVWTRCGKRAVEVHHALTRARGGALLDEVNESYHLIVLCHEHHRGADGAAAYEGELLLDGYVMRERDKMVYYGTDPYLSEKYPHED